MKLQVKFGFSNLTCKACREVTATASWRCPCDLLWSECGLHKHEAVWKVDKGKASDARRVKQADLEKGVDKPMPVSRKTAHPHEAVCIGMQPLTNKRFRQDAN